MPRILLVLFLFISLTHAQPLKKVSIQLQWLDQFQFAGYYLAKEKGFYKDVGLDVEIKKFGSEVSVIDEVVSGRATFGIGRSSLLIARSQAKDVVALSAIFQSSPLVLISLKRDDLKSVSDFEGKKMMTTSELAFPAGIVAMIKSQAVDEKKIDFFKNSFNLDDLISGKIDLMASYISNEPYELKEKGIEYTVFDPKDYGFDLYSDILFTSNNQIKKDNITVEKFRQASLKGWKYAFDNIDESVNIIYEKYNTQNKSKRTLKYEAYELKKLVFLDDEYIGDIRKNKIERTLDIYRLLGLLKNDININSFIYQYNYHLTSKQKEYLDKKDQINICIDSFWKPFEYTQDFANQGITLDYIKEFSSLIKKDINLVSTLSFSQSKEFLELNKCDLSVVSSYKDTKLDEFSLTSSYLTLPYVVATRMDASYIYNMEQIKDEKIGVVRNYSYINTLKVDYPDINIVEFETIDEGMRALSEGKIYAFIDIASSIGYSIKKQHLVNVNISGQLKDTWSLKLASSKSEPILTEIFEYLISSLTNETKANILNKWITVKIQKEVDYDLIWKLSLFFIVLFISFLYGFQKLKKSKELVEESLLNIERIFDTTIEGIYVSDIDHNIFVINKAALDIFGYTKGEFLKLNTFDVVAPESINKARNAYVNANPKQYELNLVKKDGTVFPALASSKDIIFKGKLARISTVIDLTTLKETQKDLEKLNNELEIRVEEEVVKNLKKEKLIMQQSRLAQMGEIISMIAHQWRQPLSSISLTIVAIKLKLDLKKFDFESRKGLSEFKKYIYAQFEDIQSSINNLSVIIDDFRTFYKPNKKSVQVNIDDIINKSLNIIGISLSQDEIEVIRKLNSNCEVSLYDNEMMQVILNILKNSQDNFALNHVGNKKNKKIIIRTKSNTKNLIVEMEDNGGGIEESILGNIFDPYFSTKEDKNGTGLGLHMSRIIITDHHNGRIYAQNTKDGVKFVIELKK